MICPRSPGPAQRCVSGDTYHTFDKPDWEKLTPPTRWVELTTADLQPGIHCIVEYNTTQRLSKSGSWERVIKVLRWGMLSETDYFRPRYGDQQGVWVEDNSDGGREKLFVLSRIKSVRTTTLGDLLWFLGHFI